MTTIDRIRDHAKVVLQDAPIPNDSKIALWDLWHDSGTVDALASKLAGMDIPADVEQSLIAAKRFSLSDPNPRVEAVLEALRRMAKMDPRLLDAGEAHPVVLNQLIETISGEK